MKIKNIAILLPLFALIGCDNPGGSKESAYKVSEDVFNSTFDVSNVLTKQNFKLEMLITVPEHGDSVPSSETSPVSYVTEVDHNFRKVTKGTQYTFNTVTIGEQVTYSRYFNQGSAWATIDYHVPLGYFDIVSLVNLNYLGGLEFSQFDFDLELNAYCLKQPVQFVWTALYEVDVRHQCFVNSLSVQFLNGLPRMALLNWTLDYNDNANYITYNTSFVYSEFGKVSVQLPN